LIWMEDKFGQVMNFNVQKYKGQDFITFWTGSDHAAHSNGSYMLVEPTPFLFCIAKKLLTF
jgi:hypothetical protein